MQPGLFPLKIILGFYSFHFTILLQVGIVLWYAILLPVPLYGLSSLRLAKRFILAP